MVDLLTSIIYGILPDISSVGWTEQLIEQVAEPSLEQLNFGFRDRHGIESVGGGGMAIGIAIAAVVSFVFAFESTTIVRYFVMATGLVAGWAIGRSIGRSKARREYLSRYTRRVVISSSRLLRFDETGVTFRYKD